MHLTKFAESAHMDLEVRLESIHFLYDSRLKTCTKVYTLLYYCMVFNLTVISSDSVSVRQ